MTDTNIILKKELEYFKKNIIDYLKHYKNSFVLIKGNEFGGSFTTEKEAYDEGVRKFGNEPFLIKQVLDKEETVSFSSLYLGINDASI